MSFTNYLNEVTHANLSSEKAQVLSSGHLNVVIEDTGESELCEKHVNS